MSVRQVLELPYNGDSVVRVLFSPPLDISTYDLEVHFYALTDLSTVVLSKNETDGVTVTDATLGELTFPINPALENLTRGVQYWFTVECVTPTLTDPILARGYVSFLR